MDSARRGAHTSASYQELAVTLERVDEQYRGLTYPWGRLEHPGDEPFEVAPGVWWARFAMPGPLNHINLWLLEDGDGWTIVDTCLNLDSAKERWDCLLYTSPSPRDQRGSRMPSSA